MQRVIVASAISAALLTTSPLYAGQRRDPGTARTVPAAPAVKSKPTVVKKTTVRAARPLSSIQQTIQRNPELAGKVRVRLPAGTDIIAAAAGFRILGQFLAAVDASNTTGIPFAQLKRRMVYDGMTLALAIQDVRPKADYWSDARRADEAAAHMLRTSGTVPPVAVRANQARGKVVPGRSRGGAE